MTETETKTVNFCDWKTEVLNYLELQADVGITVSAMMDSLALNGWVVPNQPRLRLFLSDLCRTGRVVRCASGKPGESAYYRYSADLVPPTGMELFEDRSGVYLDERDGANCALEIVVWDKRTNAVKYFRNCTGTTCDSNGENESEYHEPEWVESTADAFLVYANEDVTPDETPTVAEFLAHSATWIIEPSGELVANVQR